MTVSLFASDGDYWDLQSQYTEFNSTFADGSEINTGNSSQLSSFSTPKHVTSTFAPWIQDLSELYRAHTAITKNLAPGSNKDLRLDSRFGGNAADFVVDSNSAEFAHAAEDGYLKQRGDVYVATFFGAYRMTWRIMPPFSWINRMRRNATARERLSAAGFQTAE